MYFGGVVWFLVVIYRYCGLWLFRGGALLAPVILAMAGSLEGRAVVGFVRGGVGNVLIYFLVTVPS